MTHTSVITVVKGKPKWLDRPYFEQGVARLPDGAYELTLTPVQDRRSSAANRYYHGVVLEHIWHACDRQHTKDEIHDDMCDRFLKYRLVQINKRTGEVVERQIARRSSRLKVHEFYEFVEQVRLFALEFFGITIPDPDKEYQQHRQQAQVKAARRRSAAA